MSDNMIQLTVFVLVSALIGALTYLKCRGQRRDHNSQNKEYFLAGGGLSWIFVAGSITLTNLSTDQLVGMNGNQMMLLVWWELAAVIGLIILAKVFIPVYYKYQCTTTTELLEKRYHNKHIRAVIGGLFFLGNAFIYMPAVIYSGALLMQTMFKVDIPLIYLATLFALVGAFYAFFGGLRAVAVSDTYNGVLVLGMAVLVVILALVAIDFDFSGIPAERLTLIGDKDSPLPWQTLLTGMIFIQMYYWGTNQTITQRAMAAPNVKEAQKGVFAAALIRIIVVPAIVVVPGIVSYKLYGDIGDTAYGRIVGDLMPGWLSGVFAAAMAAAVLSTYNSLLNSATALYVCDIHEAYFEKKPNVFKLSGYVTLGLTVLTLVLVPVYQHADSIINLLQQLNGLLSMPILSIFVVGLLFTNVDARAAIAAVIFGVLLYGSLTFSFSPFYSSWHYIHLMPITLFSCVAFALILNKVVFGQQTRWSGKLEPVVEKIGS
ncbi:SLC5 family protein [Rheinheimera tangshanensis]|uniref:SLC5 family protein n=1 Tax=Rheinheimera tangshanensis TaxID=400153 RepID=A0A5C8M031_9GAMM|nr:SLC5 family protein [Rheinheimera tangshanensis]TXK81279.1 SLC5 family protein [Rheinheimera tangshanensis]GGM59562.1 solute:sodium symporter family transporter [Rheinheimera tangshanensis]